MTTLESLIELVIVLDSNRFGAVVLIALFAMALAIAKVYRRPPKD